METMDKLKHAKAKWYIKHRKRLLDKQKIYYQKKKQENSMKKTKKNIVLSFD